MGKSRPPAGGPSVTAARAARLYQLLSLIAGPTKTRTVLLKRLKVDVRGFYRDLRLLRDLGITVEVAGEKYHLVGTLDVALAALPFPDPGLSFREALLLANGRTDAHRKLKARIDSFTRLPGRSSG